jgi:hypothetical protein
MRRGPSYIRIISVPPGEAPLWVREKWVGLELPLADFTRRPRNYYGFGVLSAPRTRNWLVIWWWALRGWGGLERHTGYSVNADEAVRHLETTAPDAAAWWRQNAPHTLGLWRKFVFAQSACRMVDEAS